MGPKACLVVIGVAALVAGCGSSSDAGETGPAGTSTLSAERREEGIKEYLRMPEFDQEETDLIKVVSVETDRADIVFAATDEAEIPYDRYCDAVLDSGFVEHVKVYTEANYSDSGAPAAECDE